MTGDAVNRITRRRRWTALACLHSPHPLATWIRQLLQMPSGTRTRLRLRRPLQFVGLEPTCAGLPWATTPRQAQDSRVASLAWRAICLSFYPVEHPPTFSRGLHVYKEVSDGRNCSDAWWSRQPDGSGKQREDRRDGEEGRCTGNEEGRGP